jgi:hypothetical protein
MSKIIIQLDNIPNNKEEDYNISRTIWKNNRLVEYNEGSHSVFYINHTDEKFFDKDSRKYKKKTKAFSIRVKKPVTKEKIINSAVRKVYGLNTDSEFSEFQSNQLRLLQSNPNSEEIIEYNNFIKWVDNGLSIANGITLEKAKEILLKKIEDYDTSKSVNSFILNGNSVWLDKNTRVGLMNSMSIEKSAGLKETSLWLGDKKFVLSIDLAINLLMQLEFYAKECFNKTAEHKYNIDQLTEIDDVLQYNYTTGYPEKLNINL